ncbi:hypothetical protein TSAR_003193 [Trichomalopsis sarcophagae]|uniref:Uncharacterized protein n=1 Tax=Trichomalopsis sarcophagae TaxID=543379 RepID=A0A232EEU3_9HYME|nr:hypothetical protein TSAR_003193 [Trichomalopsis sarcophagae]
MLPMRMSSSRAFRSARVAGAGGECCSRLVELILIVVGISAGQLPDDVYMSAGVETRAFRASPAGLSSSSSIDEDEEDEEEEEEEEEVVVGKKERRKK